VWRLITERVATLQELDAHWTIEDMLKANAVLDMKADIKADAAERARKAAKKK